MQYAKDACTVIQFDLCLFYYYLSLISLALSCKIDRGNLYHGISSG